MLATATGGGVSLACAPGHDIRHRTLALQADPEVDRVENATIAVAKSPSHS